MTTTAPSTRETWERERLLESLDAYRRGLTDAPTVKRFVVNRAVTPNENQPLTVVASDETVDRMGDVVRADGWDLTAYKRNPVFLWAHDYARTPIGRSEWIGVDGTRLLATVEFAPTEFAKEVETLYRQRFLRAVSVGFRAKAFTFRKGPHGAIEGIEYTKQELLEISAVPVPANPQALGKAFGAGLAAPRMRSLFEGCEDRSPISEQEAREVIAGLRGMREALAG
ncbi:MAG: HK97 family phage prohead protease [Chloroflexi bacterium]|nr:HK97 family phage prohead protease [Chloroflexota bacterium]